MKAKTALKFFEEIKQTIMATVNDTENALVPLEKVTQSPDSIPRVEPEQRMDLINNQSLWLLEKLEEILDDSK